VTFVPGKTCAHQATCNTPALFSGATFSPKNIPNQSLQRVDRYQHEYLRISGAFTSRELVHFMSDFDNTFFRSETSSTWPRHQGREDRRPDMHGRKLPENCAARRAELVRSPGGGGAKQAQDRKRNGRQTVRGDGNPAAGAARTINFFNWPSQVMLAIGKALP